MFIYFHDFQQQQNVKTFRYAVLRHRQLHTWSHLWPAVMRRSSRRSAGIHPCQSSFPEGEVVPATLSRCAILRCFLGTLMRHPLPAALMVGRRCVFVRTAWPRHTASSVWAVSLPADRLSHSHETRHESHETSRVSRGTRQAYALQSGGVWRRLSPAVNGDGRRFARQLSRRV